MYLRVNRWLEEEKNSKLFLSTFQNAIYLYISQNHQTASMHKQGIIIKWREEERKTEDKIGQNVIICAIYYLAIYHWNHYPIIVSNWKETVHYRFSFMSHCIIEAKESDVRFDSFGLHISSFEIYLTYKFNFNRLFEIIPMMSRTATAITVNGNGDCSIGPEWMVSVCVCVLPAG